MAKQPPKSGRNKKPVRTGSNLNIWIDEEVRAELDEFIKGHELKPTLTTIVEQAIKRYLRDLKKTPPAD